MSKNNKTKELIFNTALQLVRENHSVTLKNISDRANVNIAAINYYFGDKDNLIKEMITSELRVLKSNFSNYLDGFNNGSSSKEDVLFRVISYLYEFCIENLGLLDYIFTPANKFTEEAIFIYIHEISLDNDFMDKVMETINKISPFGTMEVYKVKYIQLFSTFAFPLLFELNLLKVDVAYFNSITDANFRNLYVKQICKTFFED